MKDFRFIPITAHFLLRPYVEKILVFESSGQLLTSERKLIVPNANFKLTHTYSNGIVAVVGGRVFIQSENKLSLTGLIDLPVNLDPQKDAQTGTIIIEINPPGSYRFFQLSYVDLKNQIVELTDLIGNRAEILQSKLADANSIPLKLQLLQIF
jgi:hypothetical protein